MAALGAAATRPRSGTFRSRLGIGGSVPEAEMPEAALREELQRQCAELERQLRRDPLSFENEALQVQLVQMQDDHASLREDFRSMREYFGQQVAQLTAQLEEQVRAAGTADGQADCLRDLLHFHEDQGKLAGSYWRAQCEKRNDSIRFLALKLQEYTVPSAEYCARRSASESAAAAGLADVPAREAAPGLATPPSSSPPRGAKSPGSPSSPTSFAAPPPFAFRGEQVHSPAPSPRQGYRDLLDGHLELCRELQEKEERGQRLESELEACQLSCCAVRSAGELRAAEAAEESSAAEAEAERSEARSEAEAECRRLQAEVEVCNRAPLQTAEVDALPPWAHRCAWRGELDVRAGQLERISNQFDTTKRSLDDANKELQWQATSAEALRMRLADMLRACKAEDAKAKEWRSEHEQSEGSLQELSLAACEELYESWAATPAGSGLPLACQQAQWLMEKFRQGEVREEQRRRERAAAAAPRAPPAGGAVGHGAARGGHEAPKAAPPQPPPPPQTPPWLPASALPTPLPPVLAWTAAGLLGPGA